VPRQLAQHLDARPDTRREPPPRTAGNAAGRGIPSRIQPGSPGPDRILIAILALVTLWRLWIASSTGLGDAEAYYWTWSRELAPGYLDHGPLVALLIRAGTSLLGDTPLGVRLPFVLLSALTLWLLADTGARLAVGERRAGLVAAVALLAMPAYLIAGGAANPDGPLALLCVLELRVLLVIVGEPGADASAGRGSRSRLAPLAGIALAGLIAGLAVDAKLLGLLLLPLPIGAALLVAPATFAARLGRALAALAAATLGALPVLLWNHAHGWASLAYHLGSRHTRPIGFSLENLAKLVGGQLAYVSPLVLAALASALLWLLRRRAEQRAALLLAAALLLLVPGYLLILVVPGAEPHWPMAGYLPLALALGVALPERLRTSRAARGWTWIAIGFTVVAVALLQLHVLTDLGVRALVAAGQYRGRYDLGNELRGWPEVAAAVTRVAGRDTLVAGAHYTTCSQLAFAARGRFRVVCPSARRDQFDYLEGGDGSQRRGVDLLYVKDDRFPHDAALLFRCAGGVSEASIVELSRARRVVRRFALQRCLRFAGLAHRSWPPPGGQR
jgi:hypothetical protein